MNFAFLMALAGITNLSVDYELPFYYFDKICVRLAEMNIEISDNEVSMEDLYDKNGINKFCYYQIGNLGGVIYDKSDDKIVEYKNSGAFPYLIDEENVINIYDVNNGYYSVNLLSSNVIDLNESCEKQGNLVYECINVYKDASNAKWCNYYEYFTHIGVNKPDNDTGSCGNVAMSMILSYYDNFLNDRIIEEEYDVISRVQSITTYDKFKLSPGIDNNYQDMLFDETKRELGIDSSDGVLKSEQQRILVNRLNHIGVNYSINSVGLNWFGNLVKQATIKAIDSGRPVIIDSPTHAMVAYGYDSDYVYLNLGWKSGNSNVYDQARAKWDQFSGFKSACFDIKFDCEKLIPNNYYAIDSDQYLDPTTNTWHKFYTTHPNDYNLSNNYENYNIDNVLKFENLTIKMSRLRCGVFNDNIKMSGSGKNINSSYLQLNFSRPIYSVRLKISFNSISDKNNLKWASIETRTNYEDWITDENLLDDSLIGDNINSQKELCLSNEQGYKSIKILLEGNNLDYNAGIIAIRNIVLVN